jgi:hypothetical protein
MKCERLPTYILECDHKDDRISASRSCRFLEMITTADHKEYWRAEICPPFEGSLLGLPDIKISEILLAAKWEGDSLAKFSKPYIPVYVVRATDDVIDSARRTKQQKIQVLLWGFIRSDAVCVK